MKSSMVNRLELPEGEEEERKGVMYVGHLPYGFIEEGLKDYFSQYGKVTNVKLGRSKKTARSKGFAFIEFQFKEVAEIACKALNGYIMGQKQLVCSMVEKNIFDFKSTTHEYKFINWARKFRDLKNKKKSKEELKKHVEVLLEKEKEKKKLLKSLNIDYSYGGFAGLLK